MSYIIKLRKKGQKKFRRWNYGVKTNPNTHKGIIRHKAHAQFQAMLWEKLGYEVRIEKT